MREHLGRNRDFQVLTIIFEYLIQEISRLTDLEVLRIRTSLPISHALTLSRQTLNTDGKANVDSG